ncbi:MAG: DivIVA domain-containing protein, partial [Mycobacteriales bacterium]
MIASPAQPTFDVALRGYDRRQVDEYLDRIEHDLSIVQAERDAAAVRMAATEKRMNELETQLREARHELEESGRPTYAGLGKKVEQLLTIAEEEADRLRADALRDTAAERAAAGGLVEQAQKEAEQARREFESTLEARRKKAEEQEAQFRTETERRRAAAEQQIRA